MTAIRNPLVLMRRAFWPALGSLIILYFLGAAVIGENGVLAWGDYSRAKDAKGEQLAELETRRDQLAHRSRLLDPRNADPDLVDEMVRGQLDVVRPDEVIVPLEDEPPTRNAAQAR